MIMPRKQMRFSTKGFFEAVADRRPGRIIMLLVAMHLLIIGGVSLYEARDRQKKPPLTTCKVCRPILEKMTSEHASNRGEAVGQADEQVKDGHKIETVVQHALQLASHDRDPEVRTKAKLVLSRVQGAPNHIAACRAMLTELDGAWDSATIYADVVSLVDEGHLTLAYMLGRGLADEDDVVRFICAEGLARLPPGGVEALWTSITKGNESGEFVDAMTCLAHMGDHAVPVALRALNGTHAHLATALLEKISADGIKRTPREWIEWATNRNHQPVESLEPTPAPKFDTDTPIRSI
jgi:hypothetical protein